MEFWPDVVGRRRFKVDIVVTGPGAHHDLEFLGRVEHLGIHLVGPDDECLHIFHRFKQLGLLGVFLQQEQFVTGVFHFFSDTLDGGSRKRFFCCY